jgi:hypothetical protein
MLAPNPTNDLSKLAGPLRSRRRPHLDCAVAGTGTERYGVEGLKTFRHAGTVARRAAGLPDTAPDADPIRHGNIRGRGYYH